MDKVVHKVIHAWEYKWRNGGLCRYKLWERKGTYDDREPYDYEIYFCDNSGFSEISTYPPLTSELARLAQENAAQAKRIQALETVASAASVMNKNVYQVKKITSGLFVWSVAHNDIVDLSLALDNLTTGGDNDG